MATTIRLELVTPEALVLREAVAMVVIPGVEGDMGVMADHAPGVSTLRPGLVALHEDMNAAPNRRIFVGGGVAEVTGERCIILAEEATDMNDLSTQGAHARRKDAEAALLAVTSEGDRAQAEAELAVAQAQVSALTAP